MWFPHTVAACSRLFILHFYLLIVSWIRKEKTHQYIRTIQLEGRTAHINDGFGSHNRGVVMGMLGIQYSGSYGANLFSTSSTCSTPVDNDTDVALSVAHSALRCLAKYQNARTTNGSTHK